MCVLVYIEIDTCKCIADNVHILASERDHARATFKAHTGTDRVVSVLFR